MSTPIILFFLPAVLASAAAVGLLAPRSNPAAGLSRGWIALSIAPSVLLLGLFYSLAIHMYQSLGAWPRSIGENGFAPGLLVHVNVAMLGFGALLLTTLFAWPVAFVVCLLVRAWRRGAVYLGIHVLSFAACVGLMMLAPEPFLYWWWD